MMNDGVQTTSRTLDVNSPILGDSQRHVDGLLQGDHNGPDHA